MLFLCCGMGHLLIVALLICFDCYYSTSLFLHGHSHCFGSLVVKVGIVKLKASRTILANSYVVDREE